MEILISCLIDKENVKVKLQSKENGTIRTLWSENFGEAVGAAILTIKSICRHFENEPWQNEIGKYNTRQEFVDIVEECLHDTSQSVTITEE
jgi:hypothetical protein